MKILFFTDPHNSAVNLSCRKDFFPDTILEKEHEVLKIAQARKVDWLVCGGDFSHNKMMSEWYKNRIITLFNEFPVKKACVIGNHDESFEDPATVLKSPLGVFLNSKVMYPQPGELVIREEGINLFMLPFMGKVKEFPIATNPAEMNILFSHYFLNSSWDEDETLPPALVGKFQYIFLGHDHDQYPITKVRNPETGLESVVIRPGALSRGTRHRSVWLREVSVAYLDTLTGECEYIPVPCKPAKEIFNVEGLAVRDSIKASPVIQALAEKVDFGRSTDVYAILDSMGLYKALYDKTVEWLAEGGIVRAPELQKEVGVNG